MLFTARSQAFIHAHQDNVPGVSELLHTAAERTHLPWFSLTYLTHDDGSGVWETVCSQSFKELQLHLRMVPNAQLAHLLVMAPPRWSNRRQWSRFRVDSVDRGKHQGAEVLVYSVTGTGDFCFDAPEVDPAEVTHRRRVFIVDWYRHFDI